MNKIIAIIIAISICFSASSVSYSYDTLSTASVALAGGFEIPINYTQLK